MIQLCPYMYSFSLRFQSLTVQRPAMRQYPGAGPENFQLYMYQDKHLGKKTLLEVSVCSHYKLAFLTYNKRLFIPTPLDPRNTKFALDATKSSGTKLNIDTLSQAYMPQSHERGPTMECPPIPPVQPRFLSEV